MKLHAQVSVSRCEEGNFDARVEIELEGNGGNGYGREAVIGAIDHAMDGARKTLAQAIEAEGKTRPKGTA